MAVKRPLKPSKRPAIASAILLTFTSALTSSGVDSSTATWVVDPNEQVASATKGFTAIVSRVGCGSGVDGVAETPEIKYTESEVLITFRISPRIDNGTCEGTLGVPYEVKLSKPIGNRSLVDGECHPGSTAWATSFCLDEGVRFSPG